MKDRISLYPGRVKLTPVQGQTDLYDLERADEPIQEGTPLNKNSLLADATAALFGMTEDALPNEIFEKIAIGKADASAIDGVVKRENFSYKGTKTSGNDKGSTSNYVQLTFSFKPKFLHFTYCRYNGGNRLELVSMAQIAANSQGTVSLDLRDCTSDSYMYYRVGSNFEFQVKVVDNTVYFYTPSGTHFTWASMEIFGYAEC